jgi:hypothetical protein
MSSYIVCALVKEGLEESLVIVDRPDSEDSSYRDIKLVRVRASLLNIEAGFALYHVREIYKDGVISQPI